MTLRFTFVSFHVAAPSRLRHVMNANQLRSVCRWGSNSKATATPTHQPLELCVTSKRDLTFSIQNLIFKRAEYEKGKTLEALLILKLNVNGEKKTGLK